MSIREASPPGQYPTLPVGSDRHTPWASRESGPPEPPKPRLLDRVRQALRARHLSRRTEEAYVAWIRRFIVFHDERSASIRPRRRRPLNAITLGSRSQW